MSNSKKPRNSEELLKQMFQARSRLIAEDSVESWTEPMPADMARRIEKRLAEAVGKVPPIEVLVNHQRTTTRYEMSKLAAGQTVHKMQQSIGFPGDTTRIFTLLLIYEETADNRRELYVEFPSLPLGLCRKLRVTVTYSDHTTGEVRGDTVGTPGQRLRVGDRWDVCGLTLSLLEEEP